MAGSSPVVIRETRRGQAAFMAESGPKSRPAGVRASVVAGKRGMTACLCRTADRWSEGTQESGWAMNQNDDAKSAPVAATPQQAEDTRARWGWVERTVWTEFMLTRLTAGELADWEMVCPPWAAVLGSGTRVDADNRKTTHPLTGEPDAGDPPVRFGGRGWVQSPVPTSIPANGIVSAECVLCLAVT
jgi:hypothetical protein